MYNMLHNNKIISYNIELLDLYSYNYFNVICIFVFLSENGDDIIIDIDNRTKDEIVDHVIQVLGKPP